MTKRFKFSPSQDEIIRLRYPTEDTKVVAAAVGVTPNQLIGRAAYIGVRKTDEYQHKRLSEFSDRGLPFRAGNVKLQRDWKPGETRSRPDKIKKRSVVPVGTVLRNKAGYWVTKVSRKDGGVSYVATQRLIWEEHYGPVPDGNHVIFKDGNRNNMKIENLECVTGAASMARNSANRYPPDLRAAMSAIGKLKKEIERDEKSTSTTRNKRTKK